LGGGNEGGTPLHARVAHLHGGRRRNGADDAAGTRVRARAKPRPSSPSHLFPPRQQRPLAAGQRSARSPAPTAVHARSPLSLSLPLLCKRKILDERRAL